VIPRYLTAVIIIVIFVAVFFLSKLTFDIPIFNNSTNKIEANDPLKTNPNPIAKFNAKDPQNLSARAAVVIDAKTGSILFEKNADLKHLPASTTKIMTALITLEKCSPESVITVPEIEQEGTQMGLAAGDQVTVENLLYGMLINSGNDAASALASSCAQTQEQFISSMNEKAEDLNMNDTYFVNPTGFDNDYQYSTAHDLAKLANVTMSSPLISRIVATKSTVVTDITGTKTYFLENINELLEVVDGLEGIKTGQTQGSLENLVTRTTRNGNSVVVVVLGSKDRFTETQNLIEWAFDSYEWINPY